MVLDLILLIILVLNVFLGYKRGLVKMLSQFIGKFVALILATSFYKPFKTLLINLTGIDEFVYEKVKQSLSSLGQHVTQNAISGNLQATEANAISQMQIPDTIKSKITEYLTASSDKVAKSASLSLSDFIMTLISVFLLFLIIIIIIAIISHALDLVAKLPVLNSFNKLGGVILSLLTSYIMLTIAFLLLTSFISMDTSSSLGLMIQESTLAKAMIQYNPILIILANIHF